MTLTILSGGQTGVDQAALRAARAAGLSTAGVAARGWLTEDGAAPWLAEYGLVEAAAPGYPARTRANVQAADALLWIGNPDSPGGRLTLGLSRRRKLPTLVLTPDVRTTDVEVASWLRNVAGGRPSHRLLVAGNRHSSAPGLGVRAETFLRSVFTRLASETPRVDPA